MSSIKKDSHTVIKNDDVYDILTSSEREILRVLLDKLEYGRKASGKKSNEYYVCNTDEPYADVVLSVILKGEAVKKNPDYCSPEQIKMIDYDGQPVPEELCTVGRDGVANDFIGCGKCFECEDGVDCANCIIDKLFKDYARLTNQVS